MNLVIGTIILVGIAILFLRYAWVRKLLRGVGIGLMLVFGAIGLLLPREQDAADRCPCGRLWPHTHY